MKHIKQEIVASLGKAEQVSVFKNRDIGQLLYPLDKRSNYLKAGAVLVVSDSVTAVTALKGKVDWAVLLSVKVNSVIEQILNVLRTLLDKYAYIVDIVLVAAGYKSILDVQFVVVVWRVHYSGDTALCESRVAQRQLTLWEHKYLHTAVKVECGIKTWNACADNYYVVFFELHKDYHLLRITA